jgi:dsDNA-specific endonuclease/ATPase MutS2
MDLRPSIFSEALRRVEERVDAIAAKLELSETAREKAEEDAAAVESLRQRLQTTENALSEKNSQQIERENAIADRFDTQNRRFISKHFSFTCLLVFILILSL